MSELLIMFRTLSLLLALWLTGAALAESSDQAVSDFSFRYFKASLPDENFAVSPLSIHAAFSMLAQGTAGETRSKTLEALGLKEGFGPDYKSMLGALHSDSGQVTLASKLWPAERFKLKPSFLKDCEEFFSAKPQALNYAQAETARETINNWVSEKTNKMIPKLLPPRSLDASTVLALSNALYFKDAWATPFKQKATAPGRFYAPGETLEIPTMRGAVKASYQKGDSFETLSMPYTDDRFAMAIFLPTKDAKLKDVAEELSSKKLQDLAMVQPEKIRVSLPRFKVKASTKPLPQLHTMGFSSLLESPDLSRLSSVNGLFISDCFHEAVVEVDEKGTKAAAATAIVMARGGTPFNLRSFRVDRPFLFAIYQTEFGMPLFLGQVVDPR